MSEAGIAEAKKAGEKLKSYKFDEEFTSDLMRAQKTLDLILEETGQTNIPVEKDQALNERMYGDLQGLNKDECREKFGEDQVKIWRRSYETPPPGGESLKDTADRVLPYYKSRIEPELNDWKE